MAENVGGPSAPYNTQIPSITDNADIQTALRLYHYGSNTSTPGALPENSLAGHLLALENEKVDATPEAIPGSANLNSYTSTGFYTQTSNSFALSGTQYPSPQAGFLLVVNSGDVVFQQYQVVGAPESGSTANPINRTWWRSQYAGAWLAWRTFVNASDFASIGDIRYYTQTAANNLFSTNTYVNNTFLTTAEANDRRFVSETEVSENYTLAIGDINKVVAVNNPAPATITIPLNASVEFPIGTLINIYSMTANRVTVFPATGVTLRPTNSNSLFLFDQYTEISLRKRSGNEWVASGNFLET
jgi:hypothetical protein